MIRIEVSEFMKKVEGEIDNLNSDFFSHRELVLRESAKQARAKLKSLYVKHWRSGTLAKSVGFRVKYYRQTDTFVALVGARSKFDGTWKGKTVTAHKYQHLLLKGRKSFVQKNHVSGGPVKIGATPPHDYLEQALRFSEAKFVKAVARSLIRLEKKWQQRLQTK